MKINGDLVIFCWYFSNSFSSSVIDLLLPLGLASINLNEKLFLCLFSVDLDFTIRFYMQIDSLEKHIGLCLYIF